MTTRREFLRAVGAVTVSFSFAPLARSQEHGGKLPGSLAKDPFLDAWIRLDAEGRVTVFTGKAELGQGIKTALVQLAADELDIAPAMIHLVTADTALTANEGYTAGSHSMQDSGTAIRNAAAQVRAIVVAEAARRWSVDATGLRTEGGAVLAPDGRKVAYGALVDGLDLHVKAQPQSPLKAPRDFRLIDHPFARIDIPAKVGGGAAYVHDLRFDGMVHARVVRPPSHGAALVSLDARAAQALPGVVKIVRDGDFLAVVAEREWAAIKAMNGLAMGARWEERSALPDVNALPAFLLAQPTEDSTILDRAGNAGRAARTVEATYTRPYQMHASIGPSCAVAHLKDGTLTVWTHTQGVYPDRKAIAQLVGLPDAKVRCIHAEGAGCYGHNGADDAAGDAALVAMQVPGRPVRLQWMREQEHGWEPYGPAMVSKARASIDAAGRIVDWDYAVWSNTHSTRPGTAGSLLAGQSAAKRFKPPAARPIPQPDGGGDRNAIPYYTLPRARVVSRFIEPMPLRVSAMRALGAYHNVFAVESFMDELAAAAGVDPVAFRLAHLDDERAQAVVRMAAERFGWDAQAKAAPGRGSGFAFARYKNYAAYCAVACEVDVDPESGRTRVVRVVAAVDSGQVVNADGIRNQIEGAILQSTSWTLYESVRFDRARIRSIDWSTYPILRFDAVPERVEVHVIDRPGMPFLGTGEAGQGPTAGAVANAVARASGKRVRDLPLTRERVRR